jgi:hypothetical protein
MHKRLTTNFQKCTPSKLFAKGFTGRVLPENRIRAKRVIAEDDLGQIMTRTRANKRTVISLWEPLNTTDRYGVELYREVKAK